MYPDLSRQSSYTIMRRTFGICLAVIMLGLLTMAPDITRAQTEAVRYQHPEGAYQMKLPTGWSILVPNKQRDVDIIAVSESSEDMLICDRHSTSLSGLTPEQSLTTFELSLKQSTMRQQLSRTTIGGMPAVLASNYDAVKRLASYTLIVLYQQRSYQLGAAVSSTVALPEPPAFIRECWDSVIWQQRTTDANLNTSGSSTHSEVSVPQQFIPTTTEQSGDTLSVEPAATDGSLSLPAFSVDVNSLAWSPNMMVPGGRAQLSSAQEAMRMLYGPMNSQQAYQFEAKWAPFYNQSTPDIEAQIKTINPYLGQMVVARSGFAQAARGFYRSLVQANMARVSGNTRSADEALRQCRYAHTLMIGYQACLEGISRKMVLMGDPQNPLPAQRSQNERYQADLAALNKLAGLPDKATAQQRPQMTIATELHAEYLNNLSRCFKEARQELTTKLAIGGSSQPENLRRLFWTDTLQRMADDDLNRAETKLPTHRRNLLDDFNAQMLLNWGREEASKAQRVISLLHTASLLQQQLPADNLGGSGAEWSKRVNAKLLINRNPAPFLNWVRELAGKSNSYWSSRLDQPSASAQLARTQSLLQSAEAEPTEVALGLSDVPISGLGSDGALAWGADDATIAAIEGSQGYRSGGVVELGRSVLVWSQSLCQSAQSALDSWAALPESEPNLKTALELVAQSKCFAFGQMFVNSSTSVITPLEPDLARFQADLQQGKRLAEAYIMAEQQLSTARQLDPAGKQIHTLLVTAQQLAASVIPSTAAKYYLGQLSVECLQLLAQRQVEMNQAILPQMVQILTKQGYKPTELRFSAGVGRLESINWQLNSAVTAYQRGKEMVSLYQLLHDARDAFFQAFESVSRYSGQHGCSAKSDNLMPAALPFAIALSDNIARLLPSDGVPLPLLPISDSELAKPVESASFRMSISSDTGITNAQEQCRQLNRDIRMKLVPWLEAHSAKAPEYLPTTSAFRKLQMVLERASRKQPNPGLLYLATQELARLTGGVGAEQMAVSLGPIWDVLSQ